MEIRWSPEAADDFEQIIRRIQRDNPTAADMVATIYERAESLVSFPFKGRVG